MKALIKFPLKFAIVYNNKSAVVNWLTTLLLQIRSYESHKRKIIFYLHEQVKSIKYICDMFNRICRQTIENIIKRSKDRGNIENIPRKDPKSKVFDFKKWEENSKREPPSKPSFIWAETQLETQRGLTRNCKRWNHS